MERVYLSASEKAGLCYLLSGLLNIVHGESGIDYTLLDEVLQQVENEFSKARQRAEQER